MWSGPLALTVLLAARASGAQPPLVQAPAAQPPAAPAFVLTARWAVKLPSPPASGAAADSTTAYVSLRDDRLAALSLSDGAARWVVPLKGPVTPITGNGRVFTSDADAIVALDQESGAALWRVPLDAVPVVPFHQREATVLTIVGDGIAAAFDAATGVPRWRVTLGTAASHRPASDARLAYFPLKNGRVTAVDIRSGRLTWTVHLGGAPSGILPDGDRVFVGGGDKYFYCLNARTGAIKWRWFSAGDVVGVPVSDGRRVFFVALDNQMRALDRGNGHQRWKCPLASRPSAGPLKFGDALLVSSLLPQVKAYAAKDGSPVGEVVAGDDLDGPPVVVSLPDGKPALLVITGAGEVQLFGRPEPPVPLAPEKKETPPRSHQTKPSMTRDVTWVDLIAAARRGESLGLLQAAHRHLR